jgi:hypothetical protein
MATVTEALDYIKSHYNTSLTSETSGVLSFKFEFSDGRSQMLFVAGQSESAFLSLFTPFAMVAEQEANVVLEKMENYPFGVKMMGDLYGLAHVLPVKDLDLSEIEWSIQLLASSGDVAEEAFTSKNRM